MLADPQNPNSLSSRFRARRDVGLRALISEVAQGQVEVRILDIGGRVEYWRRVGVGFLRDHRAKVTILNFRASELTDLGGEGDVFEHAVGDGRDLAAYADGSFHLAHSNSVIEHVGLARDMRAFARETRRVGLSYYVQTPYFWFPIDPHYYRFPLFHWFPRPTRAWLLQSLPIAHVGRIRNGGEAYDVVDSSRLLDGRFFRGLFPDAELRFERLAGLPKSLIAVRGPQQARS